MTARSIIDPSPPWTSLLPPARSSSRSSSSQASKPKPTGKRPKNGSQLQIQPSARANPQSTTSLVSNGSMITTTTATYSGGTTIRRTYGGGTTLPGNSTLPSQQLDSSPPLLARSLPSSTPPSAPIDTCTHPSAPGRHGSCPHGCDRSETPITSVSFPSISNPSVSNPLTDPVTEPIFPSDPLDIFPTNTTPTGSGSGSGRRRSSNLSKEWRHDPKRNKKAQEAAMRIMEGCYSRKERGRRWRMKDRVRRWGRELRDMKEGLRGPRDGGGSAGRRGGEAEGKGVQDADNGVWGFEGHTRTNEPAAAAAAAAAAEETRWQPALGPWDETTSIPAPPPIPKPPRNSVVMERLAEVLGASSTEGRNYLRQAEEQKDTNNRRYADYADRGEVHEHEKMQSTPKNRTSGLWKRGVEKVKKLLISSTDSRKAHSESRTATTRPYNASRAKIVDTSLLHPHWRGRHLGEAKGIEDDHPSSESTAGALLPLLHRRSTNHPSQPAAMEVPETTTTMDRDNNKADESDEESSHKSSQKPSPRRPPILRLKSMVAPPTYWYIDEKDNESHFGEGKLPRSAKEEGKGIDYRLYHEDSIFKIHRPGFPPPREGPKAPCECKRCRTAIDLEVAMATAGDQGNGTLLQTYQGLVPSYRTANFSRSSRSTSSSSQTPPAGQFQPLPSLLMPSRPTYLGSRLPPYQDTWELPTIRSLMDFSQAPEFSAFTSTDTGRLPGTFQESALRYSLTPSRHSGLTPSHGEGGDDDFRLVTHSENKHRDFVEEGDYDVTEGEEAYHSEGNEHTRGLKTKSLKITTSEQTPTWTQTPTKAQMKTPPKPTRQERTIRPQRLLKNQFHPSKDRRIPESEEDHRLTASPSKHITANITSDGLDSDPDHDYGHQLDTQENEHKHEQYDDETHHPCDRAPSYDGTGQRPPKLFFTRPHPRALAALASSSSSSSASASVSAALPSPVPEEGGSNSNSNSNSNNTAHVDVDQQHEHDPQQTHDDQLEKKDRHSHYNRYSKSSSNTNSNSNGNYRWFRSSWSLSISTGSNPHAGPSSWYKTKITTSSSNRKRSSSTSTTSTTATTGSSRVSSLDKVTTSNDSSSSSRASLHSHSQHSRSHSNQTTTGTTGTIDSGSESANESTHALEEDTGESSGNGLPRHTRTRTASVQVDSDLLIIPLEEVGDHYDVLPPPSSSFDAPSDPSEGNDGHDNKEEADDSEKNKRDEDEDEDGWRQWEWEYGRGGWRIVDGGNGRINERGGGGGVNIKVREMKGEEGKETETETETGTGTGTGESFATRPSTGTGLWMNGF